MNTRTFPRTMAEAFKGVEYACAIERPSPSLRAGRAVAIALALLAACIVLVGAAS